jgi:hypothetical protein
MRNNTIILFRAIMRLSIKFLEVGLPMDVSWNCTASRSPRREDRSLAGVEIEDPPALAPWNSGLANCLIHTGPDTAETGGTAPGLVTRSLTEIELSHATAMMEICGSGSRY